MAVVGQHLWGDVPGNRHNCRVARLGLGQFGYCMMPQVVKAQSHQEALDLPEISLTLRVSAFNVQREGLRRSPSFDLFRFKEGT